MLWIICRPWCLCVNGNIGVLCKRILKLILILSNQFFIFLVCIVYGFVFLIKFCYYSFVFRVKQIKSELSTQVIKDFRDAFEGPNSKVSPNENLTCMYRCWKMIIKLSVLESVMCVIANCPDGSIMIWINWMHIYMVET